MTTALRTARMKGDPEIVDGFRMRGREVTRLESFSDAVFGFALTLLVVSLDVPRTFSDLTNTMRGFPAFALCFTLLALIWNGHYKFCRRFGLDDRTCRFLTCVLLFLVLFYVYPLKFLFNFSVNALFFATPAGAIAITRRQLSDLLVIYGFGFAAVYFALTMLYLHAWRLREALELSAREKFETRYQTARLVILVVTGLIAAALARIPAIVQWSGLTYMLLLPIMRVAGLLHRRKRRALFPD